MKKQKKIELVNRPEAEKEVFPLSGFFCAVLKEAKFSKKRTEFVYIGQFHKSVRETSKVLLVCPYQSNIMTKNGKLLQLLTVTVFLL